MDKTMGRRKSAPHLPHIIHILFKEINTLGFEPAVYFSESH